MKTYVRTKRAYIEIDNVEQLCRLCLEKVDEGVAIFKDDQDVCAAIAMRIMSCVGLEVQQDSLLPSKICKLCHEQLEKYYKFRKKCELSYQKLKYHVMAVKGKKQESMQKIATLQNLSVQNVEQTLIDVETVDEEQRHIDVQIIDEEERDEEKKLVIQTEDPETVDNFVEKIVEMEQVSLQPDTEPNISTFLAGVLVELGVLQREESGLMLQGVSTFQLETGAGEQLVLELVEQDEEVVDLKPDINVEIKQPFSLLAERAANIKTDPKPEKTSGRPWCSTCARSFSSRSAAARHARAHSGARPYVCDTCGTGFAQKSVLHRHMLVHLEVRPHRCGSCDKSFTQRGALEAHARAHAAPPDRPLRLHACTLCDKVFLYTSGLSRHMYQHTGRLYSCLECGKTFNDKSSLLRHRRNIFHGHKNASSTKHMASSTKHMASSTNNLASSSIHIASKLTENISETENKLSDNSNQTDIKMDTGIVSEVLYPHKNSHSIDKSGENISMLTESIAIKYVTDSRTTDNNIYNAVTVPDETSNKVSKNLPNMPYEAVDNVASGYVLASNNGLVTVQDNTYMVAVFNSNNVSNTSFVSSKNLVTTHNIVPDTDNPSIATSLPNTSCNST